MAGRASPLVVIVAFHNTQDLADALESIGADQPLLVVDNGADPEVEALVESRGGRYATPGMNIGFAAAVNLALSNHGGRDVLLVNPDARFSPSLTRALADELDRDSQLAAVAPRLRSPSGESERVEWPIPSPGRSWLDAFGVGRLFPPRRTFLIGAVLLLRAEALEDVGNFDERYFLYAEECDWQLRALKRGWAVRVAETLAAEHWGGRSSEAGSTREAQFHRSAELFGLKWYGRLGWSSMQIADVCGILLRMTYTAFRPNARAKYVRRLRLLIHGDRGT